MTRGWGPGVLSLRGRDHELTVLRELIDRGNRGVGGAVLIEGEAGIGKTRLVQEVVHEATEAGLEAFVGRAEELERGRPFAAVAHALSSLRNAVDALVWNEPSAPGDALSRSDARVAESLVDLIEERSLHRPVVVCLEDLHWADPSTLLFLRVITRRLEGLSVAVLATFRPRDAPDLAALVDRLAGEGVPLLRVGPLEPDDVAAIATDAAGDDPGPLPLSEVGRAAGNPFYVLELLSALEEEGAILHGDGRAELREAMIPPTLTLTILRRLAVLPRESVDVLRMASIVGSSFAIDDLALLVGRPTEELFASLEPAIRAGFVSDAGDKLAFRHDLVRAAIYEDIPLAMRKTQHRRLARSMAEGGRPITKIATHMSLGADEVDLEAFSWLAMAVAAIGESAIGLAVEFMQRAIEVAPANASSLDHLRSQQLIALAATDRASEAEVIGRQLLDQEIDEEPRRHVRFGLGLALAVQGRLPEAIEHYRMLADDDGADPSFRAEWTGFLAQTVLWSGNPGEAAELARRAVALATECSSSMGLSIGSLVLSFVASAAGDVTRSVSEGLRAAESFHRAWESGRGGPPTPTAAGLALLTADDPVGAEREVRAGLLRAERAAIGEVAIYQRTLVAIHYHDGKWDDALAEAAASVQTGYEDAVGRIGAYAIPARIHLHRGELGRVDELLAGGTALLGTGDLISVDILFWTRAKLLEARGEPDAALQLLEMLWASTADVRFLFGAWRFIWPDIVRLAVTSGRTDLAADVVRFAEQGAVLGGHVASVRGAALRIKGIAENDAGLLTNAAREYESSPYPIERAMADEGAGVALAAAGDRGTSAPLLVRALETYDALGATLDADRVQAALRSIGLRRGATGRRKRPASGWDALTATEVRVVSLVGEGLTNGRIAERLYISRRTVQTHLRSIFDKLGAKSRTEVVAEVVRRSSESTEHRSAARG